MADARADSTYDDEFKKIHLFRALEDIRETGDAAQRALLEAWPHPLRLPDCNLSGIDSAVVVLRRIFAELPADSDCRGFVFGKKDKNTYGVGKEERDRFRALFRYAWHYLPDLAQCDPNNTLLPLEIMDRQRSLLNVLLPDRRMDQSRISFEALMESKCMQAAFWGRDEFQPFRDVTAWQREGFNIWDRKQRDATQGLITWQRDEEPSLEGMINKMLRPEEVGRGDTSILLPNWPTFLRVKITSDAPMTMDAVMEQKSLTVKGFRFRYDSEDYRESVLFQTGRRYYLAAAVAMRLSPQGNDVVVIGSKMGMQTCPLAMDSQLGRPAHQRPADGDIMVKEGMLYFALVPLHNAIDVSMSIDSDSEDESQLTDYQQFRERLRAFDRMPQEGLTPLSWDTEECLREDIAWDYARQEQTFFG